MLKFVNLFFFRWLDFLNNLSIHTPVPSAFSNTMWNKICSIARSHFFLVNPRTFRHSHSVKCVLRISIILVFRKALYSRSARLCICVCVHVWASKRGRAWEREREREREREFNWWTEKVIEYKEKHPGKQSRDILCLKFRKSLSYLYFFALSFLESFFFFYLIRVLSKSKHI